MEPRERRFIAVIGRGVAVGTVPAGLLGRPPVCGSRTGVAIPGWRSACRTRSPADTRSPGLLLRLPEALAAQAVP